jgi:hypothetical protein
LWKRSQAVAVTTLLAAWAANCLWSFTGLPGLVGAADMPNAYVTLIVTLVVLGVGNMLARGEPGYLRTATVGIAASSQASV